MRAVVRSVSSPDIDVDSYRPADPQNDGVVIRLLVGPDDGPGEESFDVVVCTGRWLADRAARQGPQIGRHFLIMEPFDAGQAVAFLRRRLESIVEPDWQTLALKLGRIAHWEFEDYQ